MTANVVGLDLSITATGFALGDGSVGTIQPSAKLGDRRIVAIRDHLAGSSAVQNADLVVIEGALVRSSAAVVIGMVHGAVRSVLFDHDTPHAMVPPATLKKFATGRGNADKTAMAIAALKRAGVEFADDNECDAWWLRQAGLYRLGVPAFDLPAAQVAALDVVQWPALDGAR